MSKTEQLYDLLVTETDATARFTMLIDLAWELTIIDTPQVHKLLSEAQLLLLEKQLADVESAEADLMIIQSFLVAKQDQFIEALKLAHKALAVYTEKNHLIGQIRSFRVIGLIYAYLGQLQDSLDTNLKGLSLIKQHNLDITEENETPLIFLFLNNIATLYTYLNRNCEALDYYLEALPFVKASSITSQVLILANIGITYADLNETDIAISYLSRALELTKSENLGPIHSQLCHTGFAIVYKKLNNDTIAMHHYLEALKNAIKTDSKLEHLTVLIDICKYLVDRSEFDSSLTYLEQAIHLGKEINAKELLRVAYQLNAICYEQHDNPYEALKYYKLYMDINQQVVSSELLAKLDTFSATYQIEQAQKDAEIYKLKNVALKEMNDTIEEKARLLEASYRNMTVLSQIGHEITATLDIEKVLTTIYERLSKLMRLNVFAIALYDPSEDALEYKLLIEQSVRLPFFKIKLSDYPDSYAAICIREKEGIMLNELDPQTYKYYTFEDKPQQKAYPHSLIYHPLAIGEDIIAVLTVQSYEAHAYSDQDLEVVKILGSYIAIALNNSKKSEALRSAIEELEILSTTDPLTELFNRRYMMNQLEQECNRHKRYRHPFTLLIADVDYFKSINDTYGHDCGDAILLQLANLIKGHLRCQDCISRWGGEEFLMLLTETDEKAALILANRLRLLIAEYAFEYSGAKLNVTMTFGVAEYDGSGSTQETIKRADRALYMGKINGRNQCVKG